MMVTLIERMLHHPIPRRVRQDFQLVVYLLLMGLVVYSLAIERSHSNHNRQELANTTRTVLVAGCNSGNELRTALTTILEGSIMQTQTAEEKHLIAPAVAAESVTFLRRSIASIKPRDCTRAYSTLK